MSLNALEVSNMVVNRYIKSLYEVASSQHKEDLCLEELLLIQSSLLTFKNVRKFLKRISLLSDEGVKFIEFLTSELKLDTIVSNFLRMLAKNRRLYFLLDICKEFSQYIDKIRGKKTFYVTAFRKVTKSELNSMKNYFSEVFGGNVDCEIDVDESLMGGFTVQYKSKILDYSVKSRLIRLHSAIKGENYEN